VVSWLILMRLRHHRFDSVAQVDAAIGALLPALNDRPLQKMPGSRASVVAELGRARADAAPEFATSWPASRP
jgi:hypothetical protein